MFLICNTLYFHVRLHPDKTDQAKCVSQPAAELLFAKYGGEIRLKGSVVIQINTTNVVNSLGIVITWVIRILIFLVFLHTGKLAFANSVWLRGVGFCTLVHALLRTARS